MLCVTVFSNNRPLLQHPHPLPDRQSDPRPVFDRLLEYLSRLVEIIAGIEHAVDLGAVLRPLFDFVKVLLVREIRALCFLLGKSSVISSGIDFTIALTDASRWPRCSLRSVST
jgi:hypothetical protein